MFLKYYNSFIFTTLLSFLTTLSIVKCDNYRQNETQIIKEIFPKIEKYLTQDYMKENKFIVRYLRDSKLNKNATIEKIRQTYEWRKINKIDNILNEDWSRWEKILPFDLINSVEGRPALVSEIGRIDFRRVFLGGLRDELTRYIDFAFERGVKNLHVVSNATGQEWIDGYLLFNLNGFSWKEHACVFCIPVWINIIDHYEKYFPMAVQRIIVINAPRVFSNLLQALKPYVPFDSASILEVYGVNKIEWKKVIFPLFTQDQLPVSFGGKRRYKFQ